MAKEKQKPKTAKTGKDHQSKEYGKQNNNFISIYFATILQIIEDKPNFLIPVSLYCLLIIIYYLQLSGYIFSHYESKPLTEPKFGFIAYLNEVSPITFLLYMKGHDTLTLICYFIMQFTMYFYFTYVGVYGYLQKKYEFLVIKYKRTFSTINQLLNIFFTFYWWIFFTPYVEINSGMIVCGGNSFLVEYREIEEGQPCGKPAYLYVLGILGLVLSVITGLIVIFFFRCYEFDEGNLLKRRYNFLLVLQLFTRFMTTFFYYLNIEIVLVFKHVAAQFVAITLMYDIVQNWPFRSILVSKFYLISTMFFWWAMTLVAIWMFTEEFPDTVLFYPYVVLGVVFSGGFLAIYNAKYDRIMKFEQKDFKSLYIYTDFYLEELQRLLQDSLKSEYSKYKMFELITYHKPLCIDQNCGCKYLQFWNSQQELDIESVYQFIDTVFKWALNHQILRNNRDEYEHLSLKYISYLCKFRNNSNRAYFELKVLLSNRQDVSFYFQTISTILSQNIEFMMEQIYTRGQTKNTFATNVDLDASILLSLQTFKLQTIPQITEFLKEKVKFWEQMRIGYNSMNLFQQKCIEISKQGEKLRKNLEFELTNFHHQTNIVYLRIRSMYYCLLQKEISTAWKDENQIVEIKKRDNGKALDTINNLNLSKGKIINLVISMAMSQGRIQNKVSAKIANFFGYTLQEFEQIKNINQVMPPFLSLDHNEIMNNLIVRGYSNMIKSKLSNFIYDKNQFIIPVYIYLDHSFLWANDFCINATILKIIDGVNYILFNNQGEILGISENIYKELFLQTVKNISEKSKNIHNTHENEDEREEEEDIDENQHQKDENQISNKQSKYNLQKSQFQQNDVLDTQDYQQTSKRIASLRKKQIKTGIREKPLIDIQTIYSSLMLPFIIPQIIKIFLEWNKSDINLKKRYFQEQIISQQSCRIKVPNKIFDLQNDCLNQLNSDQTVTSTINCSQYGAQSTFNQGSLRSQFNKSFASSSRKRITKNLFTFYDNDILQKSQQLILENKREYKTSNCMVDYSCKIDIFANNIIYGQEFEKNKLYYTLNIKELNKATDQSNFESAQTNTMWQTAGETTNFKSQMKSKFSNQDNFSAIQQKIPSNIQASNGSSSNNEENIKKKLLGQDEGSGLIMHQNNYPIKEESQEDVNLEIRDNVQEQNNQNQKNKMDDVSTNANDISAFNKIDESNRQLIDSNYVTPLQSPLNKNNKNQFQDQTDRNLLINNKNQNQIQTPAPTQTERLQEIETTDRNNNFLNSYKHHDNQVQKDGELSVLPSPDISMVMETQQDQQLFTPRYENNITDGTNSFMPNNTNQNEPPLTSRSDMQDQKQKIKIKNQFNPENQNKIEEKNQEEEYDEEQNKELEQSLFQETSKHQGKDDDKNQDDKDSQKQMEQDLNSFSMENKQNQQQIVLQKEEFGQVKKTKQDDQNSTGTNINKRANMNIEILNELFSANQKPRAVHHFQKLMLAFIVTFIILDLVFIIFYIKEFDILYELIKVQQHPYFLNEYYQQASMAALGIIQLKSGLIQENQSDKYTYFYEQFKYAQEQYLLEKEMFFEFIYDFSKEQYSDIYEVTIYNDEHFITQELTVSQIFDLMSVQLNSEYQNIKDQKWGQGFYTMLANEKLHRTITYEITNLYGQSVIDEEKSIFNKFIVFTFIVLGIFIIILLCQIPQIKRLVVYQEKILFLVSRLYEFESQIEVKKLQICTDQLQSPDEDWLNIDFVNIVLTNEYNYFKENANKQAVLTGKIRTQNLNLYRWVILLVIMCLGLTLFFAIIIVIVAFKNKDTEPSIQLNSNCYNNNQDITAILLISELLITEPLLFEVDPVIYQLDRTVYNAELLEIRTKLNEFTTTFQQKLKESSVIDEKQEDQIFEIFNNNLCNVVECVDVYKDVNYNSGLVGVLNYYSKNIIEQQELLNKKYVYDYENNTVQIENSTRLDIINYINTHEHLEFFIKAFKTAIPAQLKISEFIQEANLSTIEEIELICWVYFIAFGIVMAIGWIIVYKLIILSVYNRIKQMHFLLTVLPHDKLQEEATLYLLKNISKI